MRVTWDAFRKDSAVPGVARTSASVHPQFYKVVFAIGSNRIKVHGFAFHVGIDKLVIQHPRTVCVPGSTCNKQR